jgi:hypothetical protein
MSRHSRRRRILRPVDFRTFVPVARLVDFWDAVEGFGRNPIKLSGSES